MYLPNKITKLRKKRKNMRLIKKEHQKDKMRQLYLNQTQVDQEIKRKTLMNLPRQC